MRSQKSRCRFLSLCVKSIGCGRHGDSIEAKDGHAAQAVKKNLSLRESWSRLRPVCHVSACMCLPSGSSNSMPLSRLWLSSSRAVEAYKQRHVGDDFALLHHRPRTLKRHFQALFFAPLLGIERLSAFDTHEHPLQTLVGRGYQSSTLRQFLGQLERVGADEALMPTLFVAQVGQIIYVDGPMIAYWSRQAMHKGKSTMLGRIMAGSQAVIAHDENGQALFVAYYPPDLHISQVIVAYCQKVAEATGTPLFVIDRAVNAVALAQAFDAQG